MTAAVRDSFLALYRAQAGGIFRYLLSRGGGEELATEALQDMFVDLYRDFPRFQQRVTGNPRPYLLAMARNRMNDLLSARRRRDPAELTRLVDEREAERAGLPVEHAHAVNRAVSDLPDEMREIVALKIFDDFTLEEIAKALDQPLGTVTTRYYAALKKLRGPLEKYLQ